MLVYKFGGTSLGTPKRMQHVAKLIQEGGSKLVILSAVSGTTNSLDRIGKALKAKDQATAELELKQLKQQYQGFLATLFAVSSSGLSLATEAVQNKLAHIQSFFQAPYTQDQHKEILAQGELISTQIFHTYLASISLKSALLSALDFMRIAENGEPDQAYIEDRLRLLIEAYSDTPILISQGYICLNQADNIDNLQRGGSDYTATLAGAAIDADEIQIWTDIDGLHNNDPRVVQHTKPVRQVSYREAAELAYFGAKILHPTCVIPAEMRNIPIRLKNTFSPQAPGTLISQQSSGTQLTAIAAKDQITALKIRSGRMLNAYGFLRKVFEIFEKYRTPIDMITTSEVSVSLTIDQDKNLNAILSELKEFGEVSLDSNMTIICIVGDALNEHHGYTKTIFAALEEVNVRMVSYGGSNNNISILVSHDQKEKALQSLHEHLFSGALISPLKPKRV